MRDLYEARNKKRISETDHGASKAKQQRLGRAAAQDEDQDGKAADPEDGDDSPGKPRRSPGAFGLEALKATKTKGRMMGSLRS